MVDEISRLVEQAGLVKTIICISVCLVPLIGLILFMYFGPRTKYPVPLAPVPGPKKRNPYERDYNNGRQTKGRRL